MKLLLLHGPAKIASRKKLLEIKQKFDQNNALVFEEGYDLQTILGSIATPSLLSDQQLIILENPSEDFTNYLLPTTYYQLILWFDHQVLDKKPIMDWVRKSKGEIYLFPEGREISVFPFLDYLAAKDSRAFLELEKLKKTGFDIHYFITMVFYLLRNLAVTPKNAKPFVKEKLIRQRKNFSMERVKYLYNATRYKTRSDVIASYYKDILEIDFKIKTGLLEDKQAEFLLVNLFCH